MRADDIYIEYKGLDAYDKGPKCKLKSLQKPPE